MMSTFPDLFAYTLPAIFVLRVTVGFFFLMFGMRLLGVARTAYKHGTFVGVIGYLYGLAKLTVGILFIVGAYTQITALFGMGLTALTLLQGASTRANSSSGQVQILLFVICFSLLFLGPGLLSFDIPL